ncbi:hypothetical protein BZA77DRAFT_134349 [Pyronema omphalodes]|nr:hypothetical protein BZA77DRAFT_134349 [Pyronema omphalodes]
MITFGNVFAICKQLYKLINLMKDSPTELKDTRTDLVALQTAFEFLKADLSGPDSILKTYENIMEALDKVFQNCSETLSDLEVIAEKYAHVTPKILSFNSTKFGAVDMNKCKCIRSNLRLYVQTISLLIDQCHSEVLKSLENARNAKDSTIMARLEKLQNSLVNDNIPRDSGNADNVLCPVCNKIVNFELSPNHMATHYMEIRSDMAKALAA